MKGQHSLREIVFAYVIGYGPLVLYCVLLLLLAGCANEPPRENSAWRADVHCVAWRPVMSDGRVVGEACKEWHVGGWPRAKYERQRLENARPRQ